MTKNQKYKNAQYKLACEELDVTMDYDCPGQTLIEAICELKEQLSRTNGLLIELNEIMANCNLLSMCGDEVTVACEDIDAAELLYDILEKKHISNNIKFVKTISLKRKT